jgi:hypothetical protein
MDAVLMNGNIQEEKPKCLKEITRNISQETKIIFNFKIQENNYSSHTANKSTKLKKK